MCGFMFGLGFYGYYFDSTYFLVLIGAILCLWANFRVTGTFRKYSRVRSRCNMTGAQAAAELLQRQGIYDVQIEHVQGSLTDHYDPRSKVLRLSDDTYGASSVAAIGVAAHECGHAIQHNEEYIPLKLRSAIVPLANFGCRFGIPLILLGLFLGQFFIELGIWVFAISVLFQIVTLPVEFNASGRAVRLLSDYGILDEEESRQCKKVLSAAALTYVAAAASSVLQLLRLIILFGNRRDD